MQEEEKKPLDLSEYGRTDLIFDFVSTYYERTNISRDYGTGESYSMTEVHMLTRIADHPGITVTELSQRGNRTKSAISQVVKRLEEKGFLSCGKEGKTNRYRARVSRAEYEQQESRTVLDRLYAGSLRRFAAALHDGGSLTEEEVRELEEYLRTLRREE